MPNQIPSSSNSSAQSRGRAESASKQRAGGMGASAQRPTPASPRTEDHVYGVVSILYHALQGAQTYDQYIGDARRAGDSELEEFFTSCRTEEHARAEQAKSLLLERLEDEADDAESAKGKGRDDDDEDDDEEEEEQDGD